VTSTRDSIRVGVVGAGAMGSGIAQVAAQAGHQVILADTNPQATAKARSSIGDVLLKLVEKGKISVAARDTALERIQFIELPLGEAITAYGGCGIVIEAIIEELAAKQALFAKLSAAVASDAVLATNTSSLSVASIAAACSRPERVIGIHFFNPAPVLPLVEIVPWLGTDSGVVARALQLVGHGARLRWSPRTRLVSS